MKPDLVLLLLLFIVLALLKVALFVVWLKMAQHCYREWRNK